MPVTCLGFVFWFIRVSGSMSEDVHPVGISLVSF